MQLVILIWTALVALAYAFGGAILDLLTPAAAWLQANPDLAAWIEPLLAIAGTIGTGAAVIVWIIGVVLIVLLGRLFGRRRGYDAYQGEHWRDDERRWSRRRRDYDEEDDDDLYRRSRRRRRDDDDEEDDDD